MPRRGKIKRIEVLPDPVYNSVVLTKFINQIMVDGKKSTAERIVYGAFDIIKEKTDKDPMEVFEEAMNNVMPVLEVKARRVGGANYQVPIEVRADRRQTLGIRWIVMNAKKTQRQRYGRKSGRRIDGRRQQYRRFREEERRYS